MLFQTSEMILFWCFSFVQEVVLNAELQKAVCVPGFPWRYWPGNPEELLHFYLFQRRLEENQLYMWETITKSSPTQTLVKNGRVKFDEETRDAKRTLRCTGNNFFWAIQKRKDQSILDPSIFLQGK